MRILVDLNHPAHVHLFRNAILEWKKHGHDVLIAARDKDVTLRLLQLYGLDYTRTAGVHKGWLAFPLAALELDWKILGLARRFDPDVMVGTSFAIAHVSKFVRAKSIVFAEDNKNSSRLFWAVAQPFADAIVVPDSIPDNFGPRQVKYPSYHELAYLHPNRFTPNEEVLREEGLSPNKPYSVVRFVSFGASHDVNQSGLDEPARTRLIQLLQKQGQVIISGETDLPPELEPLRMKISPDQVHHLLAFAQILVSDSQTMTVEAAVLGTPSVRYNTFVGRTPIIEELENRYQLTYGFRPPYFDEMMNKVEEILASADKRALWFQRRARMINEKIDLTEWLVRYVEGFV